MMDSLQHCSVSAPEGKKSSRSKLTLKFNPGAWVFWITFTLSFLASRVLIVLTYGTYRTGLVVFLIAFIPVLLYGSVYNSPLLWTVLILIGAISLSALINHVSLVQYISFVRIPITTYLVYMVVSYYLISEERVEKVLRLMYVIAVLQLPVLMIQRLSYSYLPAHLKFSSIQGELAAVDFAMGTFNGDAPMAFFLLSLLVFLLFYKRSREIVKWKWVLAIWLTISVLAANSQIQHLTLLIVWGLYLFRYLHPRTIILAIVISLITFFAINWLSQTGILTFSPLVHTMARVERVFAEEGRQERIDNYLGGGHARDGAIFFYLNQPIKWIGDGPGQYSNAFTREKALGNWGHIFTFYTEVGIVGWLLSMFVLAVIAFPLSFTRKCLRVRISWLQLVMFIAASILTLARYPMNDIPMIFTYCIVLASYSVLAQPKAVKICKSR